MQQTSPWSASGYEDFNKLKQRILVILIAILATIASRAQQPGREMAERCLVIATDSYNTDTVKKYARISYDIAVRLGDNKIAVNSLDNLAWAYSNAEGYDSAIVLYSRLLQCIDKDDDKPRTAKIFCNLGLCHKETGNYLEMWNSFRQALELFAQIGDTAQTCWAMRSMGTPYEYLGMYDNAMLLYRDALGLAVQKGDSIETACGVHMVARCRLRQYIDSTGGSAADTLLSVRRLLATAGVTLKNIATEASMYAENILCLARCYIKLAGLLDRQDFADSSRRCLDLYRRQIQADDNDTARHLEATMIQCEYDIFGRRYEATIPVLEKLRAILSDSLQPLQKSEVCRLLSICYKATGDYQKTFDNMERQCVLVEKSHSDESVKRASNLAAQGEINSARQQQEIFNSHQQEIMDTEQLRQRLFYVIIAIALALVLSAAVLMVVSLSRKRMYNSLLKANNDELSSLQEELEQQRDAEEITKSIITGGVEYAYEIQSETIGTPAKVRELFPESFVYYKPRDIVSGDWYMALAVCGHKMLVGADCTGHGIPGALLCMLGVSILKDIVNKIESANAPVIPGEILDEMRIAVKKSLSKNVDKVVSLDDGMDMTILVFPPDGGVMLFGGANQSALVVRDGEVERFKGDSNPIGKYVREKEHFETLTTEIKSGDAVYIFSDGIQDQVGGIDTRKFTLKKISSFVSQNHRLPMPEQMRLLEAEIDEWTGTLAQVDDRLLIGIRVQ